MNDSLPSDREEMELFDIIPDDSSEVLLEINLNEVEEVLIEANQNVSANIEGVIESILFASDEPISLKELRHLFERDDFRALNFDVGLLNDVIDNIISKYKSDTFCYELKEIAGGYQFFTKPQFGDYVRIAIQAKERRKLSKAALETLSIIAYRQPITKAEVEYIRGVSSDYALHKLLDKTLIEPAGRSDMPGKPLLYKTSQAFLEYFGLKGIQELPKLKELLTEDEIPKELFQTTIPTT